MQMILWLWIPSTCQRILRWYEIISGLKVIFYKSSLIGINLDENFTLRIARGIFCCNDHFPAMFVGLPLGANPSRLSTWKPLLTSIQGKLGLWKGSLLSMARRIFCLIKSVLSYLPPFYMFVFLMPQSIIKTIFSILGRFLWSGSSDVSEMCKVAWNKVIKLKDHRGLGLGSLQGKNLDLAPWWWKCWRVAGDYFE